MTHFEPKAEWFHAAAEAEANRIVSVGGLAVKIARAELRERLAERAALGRLLELRRREFGLSVAEVAARAGVSAEEVVSLERGVAHPAAGAVLRALAGSLQLPADKLLNLMGLNGETDPAFRAAAVRFALQASPAEKLSPSEQSALGQFLQALTMT